MHRIKCTICESEKVNLYQRPDAPELFNLYCLDCRAHATVEPFEIEAAELARYRQLEDEGLLVVLPCRVGDEIYSLNWSIKNEKYELHTSEIKNVRYDSVDGSITVSDGERFRVLGKTAFLTREAAEAALEGAGG